MLEQAFFSTSPRSIVEKVEERNRDEVSDAGPMQCRLSLNAKLEGFHIDREVILLLSLVRARRDFTYHINDFACFSATARLCQVGGYVDIRYTDNTRNSG